MKAKRETKSVPTTRWVVGVVFVAGMAAVLTYALSGGKNQKSEGLALPGLVSTAGAAEPTAGPTSAGGSGGASATAMQRAASANKYLFAFVYEKKDESTVTLRKSVEGALSKLGDKAQCADVDRSDPAENGFVSKSGLGRAPMPLVLAIAPNGAVTGGFPAAQATEERLLDAVASPGMQQCLKALQDRRLVFVCLQNGRTQANAEAMKGVNDFKANSQFGNVTEVVKVDPSDAKEGKLLAQLKADPQAKLASTAFLAPPGVLVAKVDGPTSKEALMASLQKAMASCTAGSSCCPAPKK